jgi:hypothetical protein
MGLGGQSSTCCEVGCREVSGLRATARNGDGETHGRKKKKKKNKLVGLRDPRPARSGKKEEEE